MGTDNGAVLGTIAMLLRGTSRPFKRDRGGGFIVYPNFPGWLLPVPTDHGHGPLAMVVASILEPGCLIAMHEHRNDEIISWVPAGLMRHDDRSNGPLITDADHLMVMNAGKSFWHSEATLPTDPPLQMLQIMVRPHTVDLAPGIQHGPITPSPMNTWRHIVGPEGSAAPFFVRNSIDIYDLRLATAATIDFPQSAGRDLYFYVFSGAIEVGRMAFREADQGMLRGGRALTLHGIEDAVVVAFLIDPGAKVSRSGTVGDMAGVPPAVLGKAAMGLAALRNGLRRSS